MHTWLGTAGPERQPNKKMVQVEASNLTTALKRVVEEAWPKYGHRESLSPGISKGGKLPPGGEVLVIRIRRVAKDRTGR